MSVNKALPHVFVLPEDDANREIANGFLLNSKISTRSARVLRESGGWLRVKEEFLEEHIPQMLRYQNRFMVLIIDFDGALERLGFFHEAIPQQLKERVFVLGTQFEPETLRRAINLGLEAIGLQLAEDCDNDDGLWSHPMLQHNREEIARFRRAVGRLLHA